MKAVIMAGGQGSRLRPLTCEIPKPMARLCGIPVIEHILNLLDSHGFEQANVTLGYLPNIITSHFYNGEYKNIKLNFFTEETPLGTAGSVKAAANVFEQPFLVISGDAICDFNLKKAFEHHLKSGATVTIVAKEVDDPREYGLINLKDGFVGDFAEKPSWNNVSTNIANTGIYILNPEILKLIPDNKPFDFANDLFPEMLKNDMNIAVCVLDGYWCDIGDLKSLLNCQNDLLNGRCRSQLKPFDDGIYGSFIKPKGRYKIIPPVYIGERVKIGDCAVIGPNTVLEDGVTVGENSRVTSSLVMSNSVLGKNSRLTSAIMCSSSSLGGSCSMFEGSVLGEKSVVGNNCQIKPNVYIWPEKKIVQDTTVSQNLKYGSTSNEYFDDDGITGEIGIDITPDFSARLGSAVGSLKGAEKIGVGCEEGNVTKALKSAFCSGALSTGIQVWDFGELLLSQMNFAASFCGLSAAVYISNQGDKCTIHVLGDEGLNIGRKKEREISSYMQKGEFVRCGFNGYKGLADLSGIKLLYQQELYRLAPKGLNGCCAVFDSVSDQSKNLFEDILLKLGCRYDKSAPVFKISPCGTRLEIITKDGEKYSQDKVLAMACLTQFKQGLDVFLPYNAPKIIDQTAKKFGQQVFRYDTQNADESEKSKGNIRNNLWLKDGIQIAIKLLYFTKENNCSIDDLAREIPDFYTYYKDLVISGNPSVVMEALKSDQKPLFKGTVAITQKESQLLIRPGKKGNILHLFAESNKAETALDLCDEIENKISLLLDNNKQI